MQFVVEATVTTKQKLDLVPSLVPSDPRVSFQGCHCHAACVLVNCEAATSRNWDSLVPEPGSNKRRRTVTSSSDSQAASAASSLDPDADALKLILEPLHWENVTCPGCGEVIGHYKYHPSPGLRDARQWQCRIRLTAEEFGSKAPHFATKSALRQPSAAWSKNWVLQNKRFQCCDWDYFERLT